MSTDRVIDGARYRRTLLSGWVRIFMDDDSGWHRVNDPAVLARLNSECPEVEQ